MNEIILTENGLTEEDKNLLVNFFRAQKEIKKQEELLKANLLNQMKEHDIKQIKIEEENIVIDYILPSSRESIDSKRLREEKPDIYDEYCKISPVKDYVKITEGRKKNV